MMATTSSDFLPTVNSEVAALGTFIALLESEQGMLIAGEVDGLLELVGQKNGLAAELAALASRRTRLLAASGLASDRAGVLAWFDAYPGETRARTAWASLLTLANQARELNRVNGELIQVRMQSNAQALEILLSSNTSASLYGPDGQSTPVGCGRISDSA